MFKIKDASLFQMGEHIGLSGKKAHQSEKDVVKLEPLDEERAVVEVLESRLRQDVGSGSHVGWQKVVRVFFQ